MSKRAAAVAVVVLALAGCGNSHRQRHEVADYVNSVNAIEVAMKAPLLDLAKTNGQFSTKKIGRTQKRAAHSLVVLKRLQHRLTRLQPPPEARVLHRRLLALVAAEVGVAEEVQRLAYFLPGLDRALAPVPRLQAGLNAALKKQGRSRAGQAQALEAYAAGLRAPIAALAALQPPPVSQPVRDGELTTLRRLQGDAAAIAAALLTHRDAELVALERRFAAAAASGSSLAAQRARIAAVVAYNRRVRGLTRLAVAVQREREKLAKNLP